MLNPYKVIHIYFKIVFPYQLHDNKYLINCQAPKYSFFAFLWEYFLDDSDREALLQVIRLKYTEQ